MNPSPPKDISAQYVVQDDETANLVVSFTPALGSNTKTVIFLSRDGTVDDFGRFDYVDVTRESPYTIEDVNPKAMNVVGLSTVAKSGDRDLYSDRADFPVPMIPDEPEPEEPIDPEEPSTVEILKAAFDEFSNRLGAVAMRYEAVAERLEGVAERAEAAIDGMANPNQLGKDVPEKGSELVVAEEQGEDKPV